jgi:hypothetical protein
MTPPHKARSALVFNSALENGLRSVVVLVASYPARCDLDRLVLLDYLLVHSGDFDIALPSMHPRVPQRSGELFVRRPLVETGVHFMTNRGLIQQEFTTDGRLFFASDSAGMFLDSLNAAYIGHLRVRASWVEGRFGCLSTSELEAEFRVRVAAFELSRADSYERRALE